MFFKIAIRALCALKDAILYRFRGGGFFQTGHDWIVRIVWGLALFSTYISFFNPSDALEWAFAASLIPTAYISMLVPHAYCMQMGRGANPQKKWPSFWLPTLTQEQWTDCPFVAKEIYDFFGMASVSLFRAIIVFSPFIALFFIEGQSIAGIIRATTVLIIGQPIAYLVGWYVPFSIGTSLEKNSICWPEFFNGAVWTLALAAL